MNAVEHFRQRLKELSFEKLHELQTIRVVGRPQFLTMVITTQLRQMVYEERVSRYRPGQAA